MPAPGDVIANRFRLVRELGRGSMGNVWLAHHLTLEVPCAIKFIVTESASDPNYRARFHVEARAIAQLKCPNVVRVLDHDLGDLHPPYIAMEFLEGEDLWTRLQRVGRLRPDETYAIVSQIARGLQSAHSAGIIHRDLKPENLFLAVEGEQCVVKLLDFGIAKCSLLDEGEGLVGTPEYMSPEQARGARDVDHRGDLWALAVITYQCLTGRVPFTGDTPAEVLAHVAFGSIPVPGALASGIPASFDAWWARAASRDIQRRFQSAPELASSLGVALGLTEEAPRATPAPRDAATTLLWGDSNRPSGAERALSYRPSWLPRKRGRFPVLAAAVVAAFVVIMPGAGHDRALLARASLAGRRIAVESASIAAVAPARVEAVVAPPSPEPAHDPPRPVVVAPVAARWTAGPKRPRPIVVVAPPPRATSFPPPLPLFIPEAEPVVPKADANRPTPETPPNKEDAVIDFGI